MGLKRVMGFLFFLLVVLLLFFYWIFPIQTRTFEITYGTGNFSVGEHESEMQFYPNMRYLNKEVSYKIDEDCSLRKKDEMIRAFNILEEKTILEFSPVGRNQEISVACHEKEVIVGRVFIAGEGGPTLVSTVGNFSVIHEGRILLIRSSDCPEPNVALHELLHALGFDHSPNPDNIMYNFTRCGQEIGEDIISLINELYSIPSHPDLTFEAVSAKMEGINLKINVSMRNIGLAASEKSKLLVYSNSNKIFETEIEEIKPGHGIKIYWEKPLLRFSADELRFFIEHPSEELSKENNELVFQIKK